MTASAGRSALGIVGTVGGAIIGTALGQPLLGAFIGSAIGAGLGFLIFPPEGKTIEGRRLDDLKVSFSTYGNPIPIGHGTMEMGGNYVWSPGLQEHRQEEDVGGKGAPSITQVTFLYTGSFRINYSEGPADAILKNWGDNKLISDRTGSGPIRNFFDTDGPGNQAVRDFLGTTTQLPGPAEQASEGINNTSAYRGYVGQEYEDMPLEDFGNRIPQITALIAYVATDTFPSASLNPAGPGLTFATLQPGGQTYVNHDDTGNLSLIDMTTQTDLGTRSIPDVASDSIDFPAVDSFGNIYLTHESGVNNWNVDYIDGSTLATISITKLIDPTTEITLVSASGTTQGRIFGGAPLPDGTFAGELLFLRFSGTQIGIAAAYGGQLILLYDTATATDSGTAIDNDRNIWIFDGATGGDTTLYQLAAASGSIINTFTISGEVSNRITYESSTNSIILGNLVGANSTLLRWDIDTQTIEARLDGITLQSADSRTLSAFWNGPSPEGRMYLQTGGAGNLAEIDIIQMELIQTFTNTDWGFDGDDEFSLYDPFNQAVIRRDVISGDLRWQFINRKTAGNVTVRTIVEDVSSRIGYVAGTDIDATELTDTLPGYIIRSRMTARKALEPLAAAFSFRAVESDFKVKFPKRGAASVATIPQIDLGATAGETPTTQALIKTRAPEEQLFETVSIEYIDPAFDNQPMVQLAKRIAEAIDITGSLKLNFPGALTNSQAAKIAEKILFQAWAGRVRLATSVPMKHILLDPGDNVDIVKDGVTSRVELHDVRVGANSIIKLQGTIDEAAVFTSTASGIDGEGLTEQTIVITGPSEFFILDIPLLRDQDDGPSLYVPAGSAASGSWPGAGIFRGLSQTSINPFTAITSGRKMAYGFATTVLPDAQAVTWDRVSTVTIRLLNGTISSDTEINVLNGANGILIGSEIVQFKTATLNGDGTYTLSTLIRGRKGTEADTNTHIVNEAVVVLTAATVLRVALDISDQSSTFFYRAITVGSSQFSPKTIQQLLTMRTMMPYSPAHVVGVLATDWTITWIRRTRVGGAWRDLVDAALSETLESYEIDILNGAGTVLRTITDVATFDGTVVTPATQTAVYDAVDQATDGVDTQTFLSIALYQISGEAGRGVPALITIGAPVNPVLEAFTINGGAETTSAIANKPTGTAAGDVIVVHVVADSERTITAPDASWIEVQDEIDTDSTGVTQAIYWKKAGASEPASWSFTISGTESWRAGALRISGADTVVAVNDDDFVKGTGSTSVPIPSLTTTIDRCLLLHLLGSDHNIGGAFTAPGGNESVVYSGSQGGAAGVNSAAAEEDLVDAGITGTRTWTIDSTVEERVGSLVAITPGS